MAPVFALVAVIPFGDTLCPRDVLAPLAGRRLRSGRSGAALGRARRTPGGVYRST
jgi:hypothetical protein